MLMGCKIKKGFSPETINLVPTKHTVMCLAVPGKVIEISKGESQTLLPGKVSFSGVIKEVNLCFVPEAKIGYYVLVHVGVALAIVEEMEAQKTLEYLRRMGEEEV
jgi:hydrogenase expression/formation protein HypC